jgi:hypothetical protein
VYPLSMAAPISGEVIWARSIMSLKVGVDGEIKLCTFLLCYDLLVVTSGKKLPIP